MKRTLPHESVNRQVGTSQSQAIQSQICDRLMHPEYWSDLRFGVDEFFSHGRIESQWSSRLGSQRDVGRLRVNLCVLAPGSIRSRLLGRRPGLNPLEIERLGSPRIETTESHAHDGTDDSIEIDGRACCRRIDAARSEQGTRSIARMDRQRESHHMRLAQVTRVQILEGHQERVARASLLYADTYDSPEIERGLPQCRSRRNRNYVAFARHDVSPF